MGKYTHLRHKLPAYETSSLEPGLAAWYQKVATWKFKFQSGEYANAYMNPATIASEYAERDAKKKALEAEISELNVQLEALSELGVACLEDEGLQKVDLATGGYVSISDRPYTSTEDRAELFKWIKKNKMQSLLTLNYQTLSGMNNDRLIAGKPVIPGTRVFIKTRLTVRGVNGNNGGDE
jgi:hypothetical protein